MLLFAIKIKFYCGHNCIFFQIHYHNLWKNTHGISRYYGFIFNYESWKQIILTPTTYTHTHTHTHTRVGWKIHIMSYLLLMIFDQLDPSTATSMVKVCELQRHLCWKINLIWSHSIQVSCSAYELFYQPSYIYIYIYIYILLLSAWWLLFVKTSWNQRSQTNFHGIKYINLIYIYLLLLYNSSITDIEHSANYIALGSLQTHKVNQWQLTLLKYIYSHTYIHIHIYCNSVGCHWLTLWICGEPSAI